MGQIAQRKNGQVILRWAPRVRGVCSFNWNEDFCRASNNFFSFDPASGVKEYASFLLIDLGYNYFCRHSVVYINGSQKIKVL